MKACIIRAHLNSRGMTTVVSMMLAERMIVHFGHVPSCMQLPDNLARKASL
jgi:hypothetical protein